MNQESTADAYKLIEGGQALLDWFGRVPSFHHAEIIDLHLKRQGSSTIRIHTWNMTNTVRNGYFVLEKHAIVEFSFRRIHTLELDEFNHQNVIDGLILSVVEAEAAPNIFEVSLEPSYGLAGLIRAENVSVSFRPGKPE